ncbi:hypothetical protein C5Y96_09435 [Blastopirellula marina]|uniref:F5/8 type C domain-containing protein n=1 Tax=Blastopirellula marina TaxID=124 RepID=A0A2S8FSU9_9BACT|nr:MULTISPECIES: DUF1553 domain-containing protein [Pirellulaceae]PQO35253.1 hypothetical protein C5Y96_09435 [Blastopirellula marina]RCS53122.1 DUF1553 domain-containing protein [Bremerella cremea]
MSRICLTILALVVLPMTISADDLPPPLERQVNFEADVLPLLEAKCHDCHGESAQEGKIRLDRKASLIRGGDSGEPGIVVGSSDKSHLIQLVAGLEKGLRMPPDEADALTDEEVGVLRAWVDQGAKWPGPHGELEAEKRTTDHWAFQPVGPVEVPSMEGDWGNNPIDQFVLKRLKKEGLSATDPADRRTLIRRLSLDLLGLPPSREEVDTYVRDDSFDATNKLIDRLLASPHFGERWATHWLDLVRFAETHGFETNRERPHAWRYRDYVIRAFNEDMPYDQFIREQIAGDSFASPMGLGYLVAGPFDLVKSPDINLTLMQRQNELDDIINTTGTAFLGLTIGCARCHNHKFDPILQSDYYSMQAVFAGVQHGDMTLPMSNDQLARANELMEEITQLENELAAYAPKATGSRFVLIDDDPEVPGDLVERLNPIAGKGINLPGSAPGQASDAGDSKRSANVSGGKYSWWKHKPDEPVIAWKPRVKGTYRVWLSWGCGYDTHCQDARYVIDHDGNPSTREDWEVIAIVNQQQFASGEVQLKSEPMWSGFFHASISELDIDDRILLVGGSTGTALTADVLLLEEVGTETTSVPDKPVFREAVTATGNVENIQPHPAKYIRFTIEQTNTSSQPCLDELAVYSQGRNVALASEGAKPSASGTLDGYSIHKLVHINDGKHGNSHSWIADTSDKGWIQIELAKPFSIDRIEWARDREGKYADRLPTEYCIELSVDGQNWKKVAGSFDRLPFHAGEMKLETQYRFAGLPDSDANLAKALLGRLKTVKQELDTVTKPTMAYAGKYQQPGPTYRLYRGEPLQKREEVAPNVPEIFSDLKLPNDAPEAERRRKLAEWIASPDNPLTARVIVNRIWQFHFGTGLVDTPSDLGAAGVPPSHPDLLDWLARELVESGWSLKHVHRLVLQSATYQQASRPNPDGLTKDGGSRLLWRYPPHRLEAEPIRDSMLSVSGVLDVSQGGPGFSAFEVEAENVRHYHPKKSFGPEDWRRMVYMTKVRMEKDAVFGLLDCPDSATSVAKRSRSTTPLQALNLFNSKFVLQQAELFSKRLLGESDSADRQVVRAYQLCFGREPDEQEAVSAQSFIQQQGLEAFCRALLNSNEFLFIQ